MRVNRQFLNDVDKQKLLDNMDMEEGETQGSSGSSLGSSSSSNGSSSSSSFGFPSLSRMFGSRRDVDTPPALDEYVDDIERLATRVGKKRQNLSALSVRYLPSFFVIIMVSGRVLDPSEVEYFEIMQVSNR